jgi:hypothetical protein
LIGLRHYEFKFEFPRAEPPLWKDRVSRWYQLDAYAYGLAEGAYRWMEFESPDLVILASPLASNETDCSFVDSGFASPSKFAHTLPNIRCSPFCQVMDWSGPVLCLQRDPRTQTLALVEGFELVTSRFSRVWILSVIRQEFHYKVHCLELSKNLSGFVMAKNKFESSEMSTVGYSAADDSELLSWFDGQKPEVKARLCFANDGFHTYEIRKEF